MLSKWQTTGLQLRGLGAFGSRLMNRGGSAPVGWSSAAELLIKAQKHRAEMLEIPSGLRRGPEGRVAAFANVA